MTGITSAATEVTAATQQAQAVTGQLLQAAQKQSVEIQGTGEEATFSASQLAEMLRLGKAGIQELLQAQMQALAN